jgi:hypothetical protein
VSFIMQMPSSDADQRGVHGTKIRRDVKSANPSRRVRGGVHADAKVAERTYYRALGYRAPATKIMQYGGQPIIVPYVEHYPPDTTAASLWLRNRQPNKWRDKHEVDVTGTLEHRLSQMTPEERARDALELAERVKRRILEYRQTIEREPAAEPTEPEE